MKNLFGRFRFVVLGVIVIVAVASCCNFPYLPNIISWCMEIENKQRANGRYVEWTKEADLITALKQVCAHHGEVCLCVVRKVGDQPSYRYKECAPPATPCPKYDCPPANIRTVKVTKSKAAANTRAGESAANDPNITYRVTSPYSSDLTNVLAALKK
jgi:hypothetical protein